MDLNMVGQIKQLSECYKPLPPKIISVNLLSKSKIKKKYYLDSAIESIKIMILEPKLLKR